jgi:transposase
MSRPKVQERFVPIKTVEQQAALVLGLDPRMLGVRDLLVKQRTMLVNAIRGRAAEFGVTAAKLAPGLNRGDPSRSPSCCAAWRAMRACRRWRAR